jgi:hypothetical protein
MAPLTLRRAVAAASVVFLFSASAGKAGLPTGFAVPVLETGSPGPGRRDA